SFQPLPPHQESTSVISVRRQWNNRRIGTVRFEEIEDLHWENISGDVYMLRPRFFVHGYVYCDKITGDIAHSCFNATAAHRIKVCVLKKDNLTAWDKVLSQVGSNPQNTQNNPPNETGDKTGT